MEDKKLLQLVSDIGFDMLSYGGEIYRVEETVKRICFAYGIEIVDVFAIPSTIIVFDHPPGRNIQPNQTDYFQRY